MYIVLIAFLHKVPGPEYKKKIKINLLILIVLKILLISINILK